MSLPRSAPINVNTNATHKLVSGISGMRIAVLAYQIMSAGSVNATFQDSSSSPVALTGPLPMGTGSVVTSPWAAPNPASGQQALFSTSAGTDLDLVTDGAVQVSGFVTFFFSPES